MVGNSNRDSEFSSEKITDSLQAESMYVRIDSAFGADSIHDAQREHVIDMKQLINPLRIYRSNAVCTHGTRTGVHSNWRMVAS